MTTLPGAIEAAVRPFIGMLWRPPLSAGTIFAAVAGAVRRVYPDLDALHGFNVAVLEEVGGAHALVYIPVRHHEFAEELERRGVSLTPVKRGVTGVEPAEPDDAWLMGWVLAEESHAGLSE